MALEVPPPEPPALEAIDPAEYDDVETVADSNYRRDEIETLLAAGAWADAWREWSRETAIDSEEYHIIRDLGLIQEFDFFWDDFADRVGYHAPGIPENWRERELHPALDTWESVSNINAGLTELGQLVCEVLKEDYIDWEAEYEPPEDLPDFE